MSQEVGVRFVCDRCKETVFVSAKEIYGDDWTDAGARELIHEASRRIRGEQQWVEIVVDTEAILLCGECREHYKWALRNFMMVAKEKEG